MFINTKT